MQKYKISSLQLLRHFVQLMFFIFLPGFFISTFNGIKEIYLAVINNSFSFTKLAPQLIEVISIIPVTIVMGRFFCGWMCSLGAFGDLIYGISSKLFKRKLKITKSVDEVLKYGKYIVLAFLVGIIWTFDITKFKVWNPWDVFGMVATISKVPDLSYIAANLIGGLVLFIFIIIGSVIVERFFCRYLCPLGAVFALISKLRVIKIHKPSEKCGKCRICTNNCAMGIELYKTNDVYSGECIQCMKCITACPRKNITLTVSENDIKPMVAGVAAVSVMTGFYYVGNIGINVMENSVNSKNENTIVSSEKKDKSSNNKESGSNNKSVEKNSNDTQPFKNIETPSQSQKDSSTNKKLLYKDGTYEGSGIGFRRGETKVSVTIKSGKITDVKTVSYDDDRPYYNRAFTIVSKEIINNQVAGVDAVSGATFSSRGIMSAVEDALSKSKK